MNNKIILFLSVVVFISGCLENEIISSNNVNSSTVNNFYNNTSLFSGSSISFFLHNNTTTDTPYSSKTMNRTIAPTHPKANITINNLANGNTFIGNWTTDSINVLLIPAGVHEMHFDAVKVGAGGTHVIKLFYRCLLVNATGENPILHGVSELSNEVLSGTETEVDTDFITGDINTNLTDRLKVEVYANQTGTGALPNLVVEFDDLTDSRLIIPATQQDITPLLNQKVNKSGDVLTGALTSNNSITTCRLDIVGGITLRCDEVTGSNSSIITISPTEFFMQNTNSGNNFFKVGQNNTTIQINSSEYIFNDTSLNVSGKDITNCANCYDTQFTLLPGFGYTGNGTWSWIVAVNQINNGYWANDLSNANLDSYRFYPYLNAGTYNISVLYRTNPSFGIAEVLINGTSIGTKDYNAADSYNNVWLNNFAVNAPGKYNLTYRVNGKTGTLYRVGFTYILIEKQ